MSNADMYRAPSRGRFFLALACAVLILSVASAAVANPIDDKRKKAAALAAEIESNGDKISGLSESYNYTQIKLGNLKSSVSEAQAQLDAAQAQNDEVRARVSKRAVTMYAASTDTQDEPATKADVQRRDRYADIATGSDSSTLQQLIVTKETVTERKASLEKELTTISAQEAKLAEQKRALESANAQQQALLNQTKGELATLIAQQQAAALARAKAATKTKTKAKAGSSNQTLPTNLPPPSPRAAAAIEFARQQLGKPYVYAATGPNSYDCSGLTMRAYGAAGLSLPHYSGAQYAMFPHVPESMLQPGDLVFRGAGGSQHVGLYIGNGLMIHAPHTGDVVKIAPIGRIIGGARPS